MIIRAAIWRTLPQYSLYFKHFFNYWHYFYSTSSLSSILENLHICPWENITWSKIYYSIKMKRYKCNYFWQPYFVRWMYCGIFILRIQYFWDKLADLTTSSILIYCTDLNCKRSPWTRNGQCGIYLISYYHCGVTEQITDFLWAEAPFISR